MTSRKLFKVNGTPESHSTALGLKIVSTTFSIVSDHSCVVSQVFSILSTEHYRAIFSPRHSQDLKLNALAVEICFIHWILVLSCIMTCPGHPRKVPFPKSQSLRSQMSFKVEFLILLGEREIWWNKFPSFKNGRRLVHFHLSAKWLQEKKFWFNFW